MPNVVCVEIRDFTNVKLVVVAKPKTQTFTVDSTGHSADSDAESDVRLLIPSDTFNSRTCLHLTVRKNAHCSLFVILK